MSIPASYLEIVVQSCKEHIRALDRPASPSRAAAVEDFREGDKVEANYRGRGRWYPGKIARVRLNGTFDVDYDDGGDDLLETITLVTVALLMRMTLMILVVTTPMCSMTMIVRMMVIMVTIIIVTTVLMVMTKMLTVMGND